MRTVDTTKKSNVKCEHCKSFKYNDNNMGKCSKCKTDKYYWNRCQKFQWKDKYLND